MLRFIKNFFSLYSTKNKLSGNSQIALFSHYRALSSILVEDTALSLTGHEILDAYNRHTENPTELQIYHQRKFASETINHNKGQDIGSQFDASTNHEIKISVSAQVGN